MATEKRLIDANKPIQETESTINFRMCHHMPVEDYESFLNYLKKQPAVDAVEVVHGRWVIEKRHTVSRNPYMDDNYHAHATCSECAFCIHSENASFGYPKLNTTNYCPNCGAKMDGDGNVDA